ncbi:MAG: PadR family transcriptional regulator [Thermoproteaceae archaeon]|jgi:DNA-binding PadR family transcriptional regulator|nr:PadR family transcriptional regulator [Thermoproteaceae archaeon]
MKAYRRFKRCIGQGNLWLYVVSLLSKRGPTHGYAIIQELRKLGFKISTVYGYVLLKRMVADGVLLETIQNGRKLYTVSETAQENFKRAINDLQELIKLLTE